MDRIAIIGLGLMGGSLGLALRSRGMPVSVAGASRSPLNRRMALERGAVDQVFEQPLEAARGADLIVVCTPVLSIPGMIDALRMAIRTQTVITDVGSTKAWLMHEVPPRLVGTGATFIGSHPICGGEATGMDAARADLYQDAMVVVTPPDSPEGAARNQPQTDRVTQLWRGVGAQVRVQAAEEHDRVLARTSHLPHVAATLLSTTVGRSATEKHADFCGSGFRDTSRVAAGDAEMWHDILKTNRDAVREELAAFRVQLEQMIGLLDRRDFDGVRRILEQGKAARSALLAGHQS